MMIGISSLMKYYNATQYSEDVFIVGKGSKDLVEVLQQMKEQLRGFGINL